MRQRLIEEFYGLDAFSRPDEPALIEELPEVEHTIEELAEAVEVVVPLSVEQTETHEPVAELPQIAEIHEELEQIYELEEPESELPIVETLAEITFDQEEFAVEEQGAILGEELLLDEVPDLDAKKNESEEPEQVPKVITIESEEFQELFPARIEQHVVAAIEDLDETAREETQIMFDAILGTTRELQALAESDDPEAREILETKLKEQCIELFQKLGIDYDEEILTQFIQNLLTSELYEATVEEAEDLTDEGTHESKWHTLDLKGGQVMLDVEKAVHSVIGRIAVGLRQLEIAK